MLFGQRSLALVMSRLLAPLRIEIAGLRHGIEVLTAEVRTMSTAQDQVMADIAALKTQVATIATTYQTAAAATIADAVAKAKTAWDADDATGWNAAHSALADLQATLTAGQPITPPATDSNPTPTAAPSPTTAVDGSGAGATGTGTTAGGGTTTGTGSGATATGTADGTGATGTTDGATATGAGTTAADSAATTGAGGTAS